MNMNVSGMTNYSTDPATYLQRLTNGSSGNSPQEVLKEVLGLISDLLKQMQEGGGQSGSAGGGMPGGAGGAPGGAGGMGGAGGAAGGAGGGAGGGTGGAAPMTVQNASGVLASYMGQNGIDAEDPNAMYQLATNANGSTPPTVQQAAQTMLANPSAYQKIETHDVAGTDGKSGTGNFQWAAQGGLGAAGNGTGGAGAGAGGAGSVGGAAGMGGAGGMSGAGARPGGTGALPNAGTLPATGMTTPAKPGTGDLVKDGKSMQMADEGKAMADFNARDGADFQAMESELSHGDGNAATKTLAKAVQSGKLSQSDAAAIGAQLQQTANAHGGGKIDDESRKALSDALGGADVLTPGKTRFEVAFTNVTGIKTDSIFGVSTK